MHSSVKIVFLNKSLEGGGKRLIFSIVNKRVLKIENEKTEDYLMKLIWNLNTWLAALFFCAIPTLALAHDGGDLTALQKAAGFITWVNIMWVLAACSGVASTGYVMFRLGKYLRKIFNLVPVEVYELLAYIASGALIVYGDRMPLETGAYVGFTGCLALAGALIASATIHKLKEDEFRFFSILFVVWSVVAMSYGSSLIGFISMMALLSAMGFFVGIGYCVYVIGFESKDAVARATLASFSMLTFFAIVRMTATDVPVVNVFENGALWMGSFVGYLGLLILAEIDYFDTTKEYILMQVVTIIAGLGAIFVGSVFEIAELQRIGGTFFVLYLLEKALWDIPKDSKLLYAIWVMFISWATIAGAFYVKAHPEEIGRYFLGF
ncbi:hypothetical protein ACFL2R_00085 [Patescibacteria group bacterium]